MNKGDKILRIVTVLRNFSFAALQLEEGLQEVGHQPQPQ